MRLRRTPWFDHNNPPVHVGWYERQYKGGRGMRRTVVQRTYWDGRLWLESGGYGVFWVSPAQHLQWRGVKQ